MRHKVFCSKTKSALLLTVVATVITSVVLTTATSMHDAHAAGSDGSATTARQKLWYQAISYCMTTSNGEAWKESGYSTGSSYTYYLKKSEYESLNWFDSGFRTPSYSTGAYIENLSRGKYDQGGIWCGEFNNAIARKGLESLGLTGKLAELACAADSINGGIFAKPNSGSCVDSYNNDNLPKLNTDLSQMSKRFEEVVKEVTFGGNVPKGDLNTFTDTEKYYLYQDAFNAACNGGGPHFGSDNSSEYMQVLTLNSSTGKYEMAGYSLQSGRSKTSSIVVYNGHKLTCQQLADEISDTNGAAFKGNIQNDKDDCDKKFKEEYSKIKDWYNNNASKLDATAQADVNDILSKYNPSTYNGGKAWTLESDGINIKCSGLEALSQEWSVTKGRDSLTDAPDVNSTFTPGGDTSSGSDPGNTCGSQAGSLGWIVCPTTETLAKGTDGIYGLLASFLDINPELVSADSSKSPAFQMWYYFRTIANIALVIILLIIILSQVTGFGIDNYGIKKMLPRVVIAAVLINVSYYLCQGAIDLSNIFGNGLGKGLDNIAENVAQALGWSTGEIFSAGFTTIFLGITTLAVGASSLVIGPASFAIGIGSAGAALGSATFWILMIPLIIAIVVALISVLIFFLMLGARQLVVMLAVAISPLAFICYILPNTQHLFKRWFDVLKALILVYPICSALYGVGRLIRILAFSANGVHIWMCMIGIMASFLPYLLAPGLLRKAFNGLGEVGARIAGIGTAVRRGADNGRRAIMATDAYKVANQQANDFRTERLANRRIRKFELRTGTRKVNRATRAEQRAMTPEQRRQYRRDRREYVKYNEAPITGTARENARFQQRYDKYHAPDRANYDSNAEGEQQYQADLANYTNRTRGRTIQYSNAQRSLAELQARRSAIDAAANPNWAESQRIARETKESRERSQALIDQLRANGTLNGVNYGPNGSNSVELGKRFQTLLRRGDDATQAERDERQAIYRFLGDPGNKNGNAELSRIVRDSSNTATDLATLNSIRAQNSDTSAYLAKKWGADTRYLDSFARGETKDSAHPDGVLRETGEIGERFRGAFADTDDINDAAGFAVAQDAWNLPTDQLSDLVNNPQFVQLVTDQNKREALRAALKDRQAHLDAQATAGPSMTTHGTMTGNYYAAPPTSDWTLDAEASKKANKPIYRSTNGPQRYYHAESNRVTINL